MGVRNISSVHKLKNKSKEITPKDISIIQVTQTKSTLYDSEDDCDDIDSDDFEDDDTFAKAKASQLQGEGPSKRNKNIKITKQIKSEEICSHFKKGCCRHGMSGKRPAEGKNSCDFSHPRICAKLFRNGVDPKKGCSSKGCAQFHPKLCKD